MSADVAVSGLPDDPEDAIMMPTTGLREATSRADIKNVAAGADRPPDQFSATDPQPTTTREIHDAETEELISRHRGDPGIEPAGGRHFHPGRLSLGYPKKPSA